MTWFMSDVDQLRERAERDAARAHAAEAALVELRDRYRRLERDRNALLADLRDLRAGTPAYPVVDANPPEPTP